MCTARFRPLRPLLAACLSAALLAACAVEDDTDADSIAGSLELDNGGLDTTDEAPMFGDEDVFTGALPPDTVVDDAYAADAAVVAMMEAPDAAIYRVALQWGQMPANPETPAARDWSGTLRVNRGAIVVRRTVRFEDATDAILPRTSPREVSFTSTTRPHNDGLRLVIVDPTPESDEPLVLGYETAGGDVHGVALAELVAGPRSVVVDDLGNRMAGVAHRRPVDVCEHGFLHGRWHALRPGLGRLIGVVTDADGEPVGHMRGIYGERSSGERVFFGKFIDRDGRFRGIFAGRYGDGHFGGRWLLRVGDAGRLGGEYRESIPGPETGGHYLGRWAETRCDLPIDSD